MIHILEIIYLTGFVLTFISAGIFGYSQRKDLFNESKKKIPELTEKSFVFYGIFTGIVLVSTVAILWPVVFIKSVFS